MATIRPGTSMFRPRWAVRRAERRAGAQGRRPAFMTAAQKASARPKRRPRRAVRRQGHGRKGDGLCEQNIANSFEFAQKLVRAGTSRR